MIQNGFLVKIKKELYKYRNVPEDLADYIIEVIKKDEKEHLLPVILKGNKRKEVWEKIDYQIKKASNITKLSIVELLKALDFHSEDTKLSKFEGMWAELRTIFFLSDLNLYDIIPLKAKNKKNEKSADFIAKGNSHKYVIEVFCKISKELEDIIEIYRKMSKEELEKLSRKIKPAIKPDTGESDLLQYYICKAGKKKQQLDETAKKYLCNKKIIIMVLNDLNFLKLLTYYDYLKILKKISTKLDWGSNYHFAIVTGSTTLGIDIVENVIYPRIII